LGVHNRQVLGQTAEIETRTTPEWSGVAGRHSKTK